jgi:hypothetical protein
MKKQGEEIYASIGSKTKKTVYLQVVINGKSEMREVPVAKWQGLEDYVNNLNK